MKFLYALSILAISANLSFAAPAPNAGISNPKIEKRQCDSLNASCGVSRWYLGCPES